MPKNVQLPDGRVVAFPDTMSDDDVSSAIQKDLAANAPSQHPVMDAVTNFGKGVLKSGVGTMSALDEFAQKHLPAFMTTPIGQTPNAANSQAATDYAKNLGTPVGTAQAVGKAVGNAAQFLIPGDAEVAGAAKLAPYLGGLGSKMAAGALGSAIVNKAEGGSALAGGIAGAAGPVISQGLKSIAPVIAEKALGVRGVDRAMGRTPGDAILNDTTGLTPGTIADQANDVSNGLTSQVEGMLAKAPDGTLAPARDVANSYLGTAIGRNSAESIKRTSGVADQLTRQLGSDGKPLMEPVPSLRSKGEGVQPVQIPETVPARSFWT